MTADEFREPGIGTHDSTKVMGFNSTGVLIGMPFDGRPISPRWAVYMQMQDCGTNMSKTLCPVEGIEVGVARQHMAESAIATSHDFMGRKTCTFCKIEKTETNNNDFCASRTPFRYIWFVDDDVIVPPQTLLELIDKLTKIQGQELVETGAVKTMVIGGIYCTKSDFPTPVAYKKISGGPSWDWIRGTIFNVEGIGTGCLLIDTNVFRNIGEKPWFKTVNEEIRDDEGNIGRAFITDDLYFCQKVIAKGYNIVAHGGVICGHYDYKTRKIYGLPEDSPPNKMARDIEKDPSLLEKYLNNIAAREAEAAAYTAVLPVSSGDTSASV